MTAKELCDRLWLDQNERLFVMLYWTEQLTIQEVAAVLGISNTRAAAMGRSIKARARNIVENE